VTLVVVTHDHRIFPFADRILHLEAGRLVRASTPRDGPPSLRLHREYVA
jgi:ABC-type siderophore export system fused ATPase/permease subunit